MNLDLNHRIAQEPVLKVPYTDQHIVSLLSEKLQTFFRAVPDHRPIVFVCIGTDRSTGDSLGPLVGSFLQKNRLLKAPTFGTIDHPVHAVNLGDTLRQIEQQFKDPFIVGVDACLGQAVNVGCIQIGPGPVKPGAGVNKDLPPVGDIHVKGIVNVGGFMEYFVLQNTRLSLVMKMAEIISESFYLALLYSNRINPMTKTVE